MRRNLLVTAFIIFSSFLIAQNVYIPDANFKSVLLNHDPVIDTNGDGEIQVSEAEAFTGAITAGTVYSGYDIDDLTGIEAFVNVTELYCGNNYLTQLDLTANKSLKVLDCYNNKLTSLDLTQNTELIGVECGSNKLTELDVSQNPHLIILRCYLNELTALDVSQNTSLTELNCAYNKIEALEVSQNKQLNSLYCYDNQIKQLDITENELLEILNCEANQIPSIVFTQNPLLRVLNCANNQLSDIDISLNPALEKLYVYNNNLNILDVSQNTQLKEFYCNGNQVTQLDLSKHTKLEHLYCFGNQLTKLNLANGNNAGLVKMDATTNPALTCIQIDEGFTPPAGEWKKDATAEYNADCVMGVSTVATDVSFVVYPNPVKEVLHLEGKEKPLAIEIYNSEGRLMVQAENTSDIKVNHLSPGVYTLVVIFENSRQTKQFIKQ